MAKHKKHEDPTPDPKPGLVELPTVGQAQLVPGPDRTFADRLAEGGTVEETVAYDVAPAPVPPPDLTDQKTVHDLRVAGRLWRVREKAGGPAALLVTETKEQAEAAFRLLRPGTGPLKTEKLLP